MKPHPFQLKTIYATEREFDGRALIANEMGLGKTLTALWFIKRAKLGDTLPALIICPRVVRAQWIQAVRDVFRIEPTVLQTRTPFVGKQLDLSEVMLINYDVIHWWRYWLEDQEFQTVVVDECQRLGNPKRKRTKTSVALMKQAEFALALSGTPLENRPMELFCTLNALNPKHWYNRNAYGHRYCGAKYGFRGWEFNGASNIPELNARLKQSVMVRYLKKDVLKELPPKVRTIVPVELSDVAEYERAKNDFLGWLKDTYPDRLNKAIKAAALVKSGHLMRLVARLKLRSVVEWINLHLSRDNEKLLVFAVHRKCIEAMQRHVKAKSVVVNGSITGKRRDEVVNQWQTDPKTRVLFGNIIAAGVGLNLPQASNVCIVELMQKPGPLLQVEDRPHRMGQDKTVFIYYFLGLNTIEETVCKLIQRKQKVITGTLDGGEVENDFDLYDQMIEELEKGEFK